MKKDFKKKLKLIFIAIFTLNLTLTWTPSSLAQLDLFTTPTSDQPAQSLPWDLNKAYTCGKFWCSDVYIYSGDPNIRPGLGKKAVLTPELTLTAFKDIDSSRDEIRQKVEQRAKLVTQIFKQIFYQIVSSQTTSEVPPIADWQFWLPPGTKQLGLSPKIKPLHPWTPDIQVGIENQQTVIYVPAQPELGLSSQAIVTLTQADAKGNGKTVEELSRVWQNQIQLSFSSALWGHELNRQHPLWRWAISGAILGVTLGLMYLIELIRSFLRKWNNKLRRALNEINDSLAVEPETISSQQRENSLSEMMDSSEPIDDSICETNSTSVESTNQTALPLKGEEGGKKNYPHKILRGLYPLFFQLKKTLSSVSSAILIPSNILKRMVMDREGISSQYELSEPKQFLRVQTRIKQELNFCQFFLSEILILEILSLTLGLSFIFLIFRQTRFFSVFLFNQTLILILLWIGLIFVNKILHFAIDYYLNNWASDAQAINPSSNRYTLRASTYSVTLKRATSFLAIIFGLYLSISSIGINPAVLAGAGIFAVAVAFLGRSLVEDMLNGILILWTDRYAIGDVVNVGEGMAGTVEDINLFITSLRNLDGESIAIPNSKISSVINKTKYWSRVNFTIRIAWNQDIDRAIAVMTQVADQMQREPEWVEKFLEPAQVLGVDEVSHEGILVHLIIKTQPNEQWSVGRELRRRVKLAFDKAGISVGIPHQTIAVIHSQQDETNLTNGS